MEALHGKTRWKFGRLSDGGDGTQILEAVRINRSDGGELINNKSEWNNVTFPRVRVDDGTDD